MEQILKTTTKIIRVLYFVPTILCFDERMETRDAGRFIKQMIHRPNPPNMQKYTAKRLRRKGSTPQPSSRNKWKRVLTGSDTGTASRLLLRFKTRSWLRFVSESNQSTGVLETERQQDSSVRHSLQQSSRGKLAFVTLAFVSAIAASSLAFCASQGASDATRELRTLSVWSSRARWNDEQRGQ